MKHWFGMTLCSIAACLLLTGCPTEEANNQFKPAENNEVSAAPEHEHHEYMAVLGNHEYHVELKFDDEAKKAILVVTADDAKTAVPIEATELVYHQEEESGEETEVIFKAEPLEGEADGKSSQFVASELPEGLDALDKFHGHVYITVAGKEYEGDLGGGEGHSHEEGEGHGEDHSHGDGKGHSHGEGEGHSHEEDEGHGEGESEVPEDPTGSPEAGSTTTP